ncbi:unnamed protein product [Urochloa humidicola]
MEDEQVAFAGLRRCASATERMVNRQQASLRTATRRLDATVGLRAAAHGLAGVVFRQRSSNPCSVTLLCPLAATALRLLALGAVKAVGKRIQVRCTSRGRCSGDLQPDLGIQAACIPRGVQAGCVRGRGMGPARPAQPPHLRAQGEREKARARSSRSGGAQSPVSAAPRELRPRE